MVKFEGRIGTAIFNAQKRFLKNSPHDVQIKGGGVKGLLNNVKKTALFLMNGFPYLLLLVLSLLIVLRFLFFV